MNGFQTGSLDDLRDEVKSVADRRGYLLKRVPPVDLIYHVGTKSLGAVERVRHGGYAGRIHGVHAIHQRKNVGKLVRVALDLGVIDTQSGQMGDLENFFPVQAQSFEGPLEIGLNYLK